MLRLTDPSSVESIRRGAKVAPSPAVSIVIPAYLVSDYIVEALESVFAQTFTDYEILVVNDGSPDTVLFEQLLERFSDSIVYLKQPHRGAGEARNFGIREARGKLIAFLDGDDVWFPRYLQSQVSFLKRNACDMVYANALLFTAKGSEGQTFMESAPSTGEVTFNSLLEFRCCVITSGTLATKSTIVGAGMFEVPEVRAHDFVLWLKMAKHGARIKYQREVLLKYRVRVDGLTGTSIERTQRTIDVLDRVEKDFDLTTSQQDALRAMYSLLKRDMCIEVGKAALLREDYVAARESFLRANEVRISHKLELVMFFLDIAPSFLLKVYRALRADEIAFLPKQ